jgi:endonuclease YncB( thermonuclease family)
VFPCHRPNSFLILVPNPMCRESRSPSGVSRIVVLSGSHGDDNLNNESLVIRVDFGKASFLFPGDLEEDEIEPLVDYYLETGMLDTDVLKVGHHGSHNATTPDFLAAITPRISVITVGPWDYGRGKPRGFNTYSYGHPRQTVIDMLSSAIQDRRSKPVDTQVADKARSFHPFTITKKIYATAWDGDVVVSADLEGRYRTLPKDSHGGGEERLVARERALGTAARAPLPEAAARAKTAASDGEAPAAVPDYINGVAVFVPDGDTLHIRQDGKQFKVQLLGVDCPEYDQEFGRQAQEFTKSMVGTKPVTVVVKEADRWGRFVGEAYVEGHSVNRELVRKGLAWWYEKYAGADQDLKQLSEGAKAARRGLWAQEKPVPPWQWRQGQ